MGAGKRAKGIGASGGVALGPAHLMRARVAVAERRILRADRETELARLSAALDAADEQLVGIRRFLDRRSPDGEALVDAQRLMLRSPEIEGETRRMITDEALAAEWAVTRAIERIRATFAALSDPFFRARGADFEAVGERLVRVLLGLPENRPGREQRRARSPSASSSCRSILTSCRRPASWRSSANGAVRRRTPRSSPGLWVSRTSSGSRTWRPASCPTSS